MTERLEIVGCPQRLPGEVVCGMPAEVVCRYEELTNRTLTQLVILQCVEGHEYCGPAAGLVDTQPQSE